MKNTNCGPISTQLLTSSESTDFHRESFFITISPNTRLEHLIILLLCNGTIYHLCDYTEHTAFIVPKFMA